MTYIFYDTETTGLDGNFDQILQFAAIKTDDDLNVVEKFDIRCRVLPWMVPSPVALIVTGVSVKDLTAAPLSHFEMCVQIHRKMNEWSTGGAIFLGWNTLKFDELLLRQAYYHSLLPIYQTVTGANGRADVMRMVQMASVCAPAAITIPMTDVGKATFKLGVVAAANGVALDHAHEALADTTATLAIARLLKGRAPDLWRALLQNAHKQGARRLIDENDLLVFSEHYMGCAYTCIVAPLAPNAKDPMEFAFLDLQFDPSDILGREGDQIAKLFSASPKPIRTVRLNAQPGLLPYSFVPMEVRGGLHPENVYRQRAAQIRKHVKFQAAVGQALASRDDDDDDDEPEHLEQKMYGKFASPTDLALMRQFHREVSSERVGLIGRFEDCGIRFNADSVSSARRTAIR